MTLASNPAGDPLATYRRLEVEHGAAHEAAKARSFRLGSIRAATFLAVCAALLAYDVFEGASAEAGSLLVAGVLTVVFIVEIAIHRRVRHEVRWKGALLALAREGSLRLERDWEELEESLPARERLGMAPQPGHAYSTDLAVAGRASLARLLGPVTSAPGRATALKWLLEPASPDEARARAEAAREMAPALAERMELAAHGRLAPNDAPGAVEGCLAWAEADPWTIQAGALRMAAYVLPVLLVATVAADVFIGTLPYWLLPGAAQIWVLRRVGGRLAVDFKAAEAIAPALAAYVPQLKQVADWRLDSEVPRRIASALDRDGIPAHARLAKLGRLLDTVASRRNLFYGVLAPILLLDFHLGLRLDRWRESSGAHLRGWLDALGEFEALCGLATLAHDHPDWTFPSWIQEGTAVFTAEGIGHPLLHPAECKRNSVTVGPPGTFLLVTGSNMSGKSTLLRSIGTNAVLAGAGGPVCASALTLPRVQIRTSMSIEDSLSQGVSLFMAQLLRVRSIVEQARAQDPDAGPVLFLLDEILHGTNSAERRIAARAVLRHLVGQGAIGAVSTHDLALADAEDLAAVANPVHFRETVHREGGQTTLDFDYVMRPGLAQTSNALALLEAVGLQSIDPSSDPQD